MDINDNISEEAILRAIEKVLPKFIKDLQADAPGLLAKTRKYRKDFEKRLADQWKQAFDLYETILVMVQEAGETFNQKHREQASLAQDYKFDVLTRLHARACLTASEIYALIRTGHPDGALARWRTLHEVVVILIFIQGCDQETAKRYLEHEIVESYSAMEEHQIYHKRLNQDLIPNEEMEEIYEIYNGIIGRYGESFKGRFGWALEAIKTQRPDFKGQVKFHDLEKIACIDHLKPYYRMSSHSIHGGSKGIKFSLGLFQHAEVLLAGPSNAGLADPGHCACISLLQATSTLINHDPDLEDLLTVKGMQVFVDQAGEAFLSIHRKMEEVFERDMGNGE